jgi:hypothetical protein
MSNPHLRLSVLSQLAAIPEKLRLFVHSLLKSAGFTAISDYQNPV